MARRHFLAVLALLFAAEWLALAIDPVNRRDWALENALVVLFALVIAWSIRRFPLSRVSYGAIFLFLCLHEIGAHYSYSQVPYDAWAQDLLGFSANHLFGWRRNNFDRLVHFAYGLLLTYPMRELFLRIANARGFWGYFLPLQMVMASSMLFEIMEWTGAMIFGKDLGEAYVGMQGDPWDAQKDMALATLGAVIAMALTAAVNAWLRRDFAREWVESLRVKRKAPLGEEELARLWNQHR